MSNVIFLILNIFLAGYWFNEYNKYHKWWQITLFVVALISAISYSIRINTAHAADFSRMQQSVVAVQTDDGMGSGVIIGPNTILTAKHVVKDAKHVTVSFYGMPVDLTRTSTKIVMIKDADAAVITIKVPPTLPVIVINCNEAKLMDDITIVGYPLGLGPMFSVGNISAPEMLDMGEDGMSYLTWAPINHGDSGGPVFNKNNELIAIAHATLIDDGKQGATIGALTAIAPICNEVKKEIR